MALPPITWRNVNSTAMRDASLANQSISSATQNIRNALQGFGSTIEGVQQEQTDNINDAFDMQLRQYADADSLRGAQTDLLQQIQGMGPRADQGALTSALDSRISTLDTQAANARQRQLNQWTYDDTVTERNRRPLIDEANRLQLTNDPEALNTFLDANAEALGSDATPFRRQVANQRLARSVNGVMNGNWAQQDADSTFGMSDAEQQLLERSRTEQLSPEDLSTLNAAITRVAPQNTQESRLARRIDYIRNYLTRLGASPQQIQSAIEDVRADMTQFTALPAVGQQQLNAMNNQVMPEIARNQNMFLNPQPAPSSVSAVQQIATRMGKDWADDGNQTQATMITNWLTELQNRGIQVTTQDADGNDVTEYVRIPVNQSMVDWAVDQYNDEWFATDASRSKLDRRFLQNFGIADQYASAERYTAESRANLNRIAADYGVGQGMYTQNLVNSVSRNQQRLQQAAQPAAPVPAPAPQQAEPQQAPANTTQGLQQRLEALRVSDFEPITSGRNRLSARTQLERAQSAAEDLDESARTLGRRSGLSAERFKAMADELVQTGDVRFDPDTGRRTQEATLRRLRSYIQDMNVTRREFLQ